MLLSERRFFLLLFRRIIDYTFSHYCFEKNDEIDFWSNWRQSSLNQFKKAPRRQRTGSAIVTSGRLHARRLRCCARLARVSLAVFMRASGTMRIKWRSNSSRRAWWTRRIFCARLRSWRHCAIKTWFSFTQLVSQTSWPAQSLNIETVTLSEPILIVTELMVNGALNKYLQSPDGQLLSQKV